MKATNNKYPSKKIILIAIAVILILLVMFQLNTILQPAQEVEQSFSFSDFNLTKTIKLQGENRTETYSINTKNPIVGFLIIPKSIASDISLVKISGDYSTEIIKADPILFIKQKEYTPGVKEIKIETKVGETTHTALFLPIELIEYEKFTTEEKSELKEIIKQFEYLDKNYFTQEEVQKIMEEFAFETKVNLEEKQEVQIHFAEIEQIKNINENTNSNSLFELISTALINTVDKRIPISETKTNEEYGLLIEIPKSTYIPIPTDINLYLSKEIPLYSTTVLFNAPKEVGGKSLPLIELEESKVSKFIDTNITLDENGKTLLSLSIELPISEIDKYKEGEIITTKLILSYYLSSKKEININVIISSGCEQQLTEIFNQNDFTESEKAELLKKCDENKIIDYDIIIVHYLETFLNNRNKIMQLPSYNIKEGEEIKFEDCENGCNIKSTATSITRAVEEKIKQTNGVIEIPSDEEVIITLIDTTNSETYLSKDYLNAAKTISYTCNSPCIWNSNPDLTVNKFNSVSIAYSNSVAMTPVKILGKLQKDFIGKVNFVSYTKEPNLQLEPLAMTLTNKLKSENKVIYIIKEGSVEQEIKVYGPDGILETQKVLYNALVLRKPIKLPIDGGYDPNTPNNCSGYVQRFAKRYFSKNYAKTHAWYFAETNHSKYRAKFDRKTETGGMTKEQFEAFAGEGKFITPGTIIGVHNPRSSFNSVDRIYTHVVIYIGEDKGEHIFAENAGGPKIRTLPELMSRYKIIDVIEPKNS